MRADRKQIRSVDILHVKWAGELNRAIPASSCHRNWSAGSRSCFKKFAPWRPRKTVVKRIDNEEAVRQENPTALELAPRTLFGIWLRLLTGRQSSRQKQHCANGSNQQRSSRAPFGDPRTSGCRWRRCWCWRSCHSLCLG